MVGNANSIPIAKNKQRSFFYTMNPPTSGSTSIDPTAMKQGAHLQITTAGCVLNLDIS